MSKPTARELAVQLLERTEQDGAYTNLILNQVITEEDLSLQERALLTELVYGVMQNKRLIDYYLSKFLKPSQKLDGWVRQLLRVAVYQLVFLDQIPTYAAINEAVQYAKRRGHRGISGLVNGVLRNIDRHPLKNLDDITSKVERIGTQYSLPDWLVKQLVADYGEATTEAIAQSFNQRAHVSVRVNTQQLSRDEALEQLQVAGFEVTRSELSPVGLIIQGGLPTDTELFQQGAITIQDEAAMLVAPALEVEPADYVWDACAAPGGKSAHIATYLDKSSGGQLLSTDIHEHKISLIKASLHRQKQEEQSRVDVLDAREVVAKYGSEQFDKILVDAPCSGIGLLRRKPDIRFQKSAHTSQELAERQLDILTAAAKALKVGGRLVYATCTILKEENEAVIATFLKEHPNFQLSPIKVEHQVLVNEGMVTILPHQFESDGFFIAALEKITS
ncbi:16S rRNA (cytosine(967)-C(5))-methyltransferase RsmB [Dolosigranulum savutiense]|uniref:16S rRNA (cytosine(967)-C(5))-methyltransferase n=1 Tax=Dolosigranulum savutiense TaxID=3110288 RepID=A0AB74TSX7_9LACT